MKGVYHMYKYYPAIVVDKEDVTAICSNPVTFKNNRPENQEVYDLLEDYFGQPIIQIHPSAKADGQLILIVSNGMVQTHPITKHRIVMLDAPAEDLKVILQDIFAEHPDKNPVELYEKYSFRCPVSEQFKLHEWFKKNYIENQN